MATKYNIPKAEVSQLEGMLGRKYSQDGNTFDTQDGEEPPLPYSKYLREKASGYVWPWSLELARRRDLVENWDGDVHADMSEEQKYFERKYRTAESQEEIDAIDAELKAFIETRKAAPPPPPVPAA